PILEIPLGGDNVVLGTAAAGTSVDLTPVYLDPPDAVTIDATAVAAFTLNQTDATSQKLAPNQDIGLTTFDNSYQQSGGTNITIVPSLGHGATSGGTYNLGNSGALTTNSDLIGDAGNGAVTQAGGTNTVQMVLPLGANAGAHGSYA